MTDVDAITSMESQVPDGVLAPEDEESYLQRFNPDLPAHGTIGSDDASHGQAVAFLMRVGREADEARQDYIAQAESNAKVYAWGQELQPGSTDVVANEIQTAVLSITDIQTREPLSILIRPIETRDKPQVFWIGPAVDERVAMLTGLPVGLGMVPEIDPLTGQQAVDVQADPMTGAVVQVPRMRPADPESDPIQPLDEVTAWQLKRLSGSGAFPPEWMVSVDDRLVADVYQTVFDVYWADQRFDDFVRDNLLCTNVFGYQTASYEWDSGTKKHKVKPISIRQAFLDPEQPSLELANYAGFDIEMDVDRAKAEWPQLASIIDTYAKIGYPSRVDGTTQFGVGSDRAFYRRTVTFRVMWFRNQVFPMTPEEATASGLVQQVSDPLTGETAFVSTQPASPDAHEAGEAPAVEAGEHATGVEAQEGAPAKWPTTLGIRQIATLAQTSRIVQDIRCEHWDIPMLLNKCIPIPMQPFGQGLPEKLRGMQQADTQLLAATVKYAQTFANPGCMIPQSVATAMGEGLKRTHIDPTESLVVPDDLIRNFGANAVLWFSPPAMSPAVAQAMQAVNERMQSTSGHPEVMSGKPPSPNASGRLVEALQAGAAGQFGFQAQWTAQMVSRLANLMHYSHLWRLDLADVMDVYSRLPSQVMRLVVERGRRSRWDIQVDVSGGGSGTTTKKLQRALALFQARSGTGEPAMPLQMVREAAGIDHEEATNQYRAELQNAAPPMAAPMPAPAGDGGGDEKPGDTLAPREGDGGPIG